ncbi:outer membrane beta-barrel protein [Chitinophaga rhizophila]|uniref:TonB-dependent receptor n=1 Tax=Chitinophaga rhizophila TaxID=2866212 RepID=A0ABS7GJ09_9BACT|nr:outer membrane beta-barrel protein [Chitinophaga rhizophila]MBW8687683.1 TonB-dependent receptor [Chitinophaga rhizophila]
MKKILLIVILAFAGSGTIYAQKVSGKINVKTTETNGQPVPFANVLLRHAKDSSLVKGELSGQDGTISFDHINEGKYFIEATLMGYTKASTSPFTVDANHKLIQLPALTLSPSSKTLQGVTVSAQKPFIERKNGATVLNVESSLAASGGTALDVLKRAPGVQIDKDDNIILQGNQGATIMLDGKLTYLSGEQLANLLRSLPSENISTIEIITSPSAKYDAAGKSGIINIKTKKTVITGMNGSYNITVGAGKYAFYNTGINLNWRTEKFNLFGSYNNGNRGFFQTRYIERRITGDVPQLFVSDVFNRRRFKNNNYKAGLDYFINSKHTIGALVRGYDNHFQSDGINTNPISTNGKVDSTLYSGTRVRNAFSNISVNLNYKGQLDTSGTEITLDADWAKFKDNNNMQLNDSMTYFSNRPGNYQSIKNMPVNDVTIRSIKADLILPFNKSTKLETGFKISTVKTDNNLRYDSLLNGKYERAITQSNQFIYTEEVYAAYAIFKKQVKNTDIQAGLRVEQTRSDGHSVTLGSHVKRSYLDFFPSFSIDQKLSESHKIGANYSKRISRPNYGDLNPFVFYIDKFNYFKGNPYMLPEYMHKAELNYTFKQKYVLAVSYGLTKNVVLEYMIQDDSSKVTTFFDRNFEKSNVYAITLTIPIDPFKWWNITNNINANRTSFDIKDTTVNLTTSTWGLNYQSTHTFTLPKDWKLELNGYYESPFTWGVYRIRSSFAIGAGVQKSFMNKKLVTKLNVSDITNREQFRGSARFDNINMYINNRWQNRRVNLSLTWNFGNSNIKAARDREAGSEQQRVGG